MNNPTLQDKMDEVENLLSIISKEITEISQILKGNHNTNLEAIEAKIINDLSDKMDKYECSKEILNYLKDPVKETRPTIRRYTPPNYMIGELGPTKNPDASRWPFGESPK